MNNRRHFTHFLLIVLWAITLSLPASPVAAGGECALAQAFSPSARRYWALAQGGAGDDFVYAIDDTPDGGAIVGAYTNSFGAGGNDFWVLRIAPNGRTTWQKTYGGSGDERVRAIEATRDGGFLATGRTDSFGAGGLDAWVVKLAADGTVAWQQTLGEAGGDTIWTMQETSDRGYVIAERTHPAGVPSNELWVVRLDSAGAVVWQKSYGGPGDDRARSIHQTADGGFIVAGWTTSFGAGSNDFWLLRLTADGSVVWQETFGGPGEDKTRWVRETSDGGYIVAGRTDSFGAGAEDLWVLKLDAGGSVMWQNTYGGPGDENAWAGGQTPDGGYVLAGRTNSFGAGGDDLWVLKLNGDGGIAWQKTFGGPGTDRANALAVTPSGDLLVAGRTDSFGAGGFDLFILRLRSDGAVANCPIAGESDVLTIPGSVSPAVPSFELRTTATTVLTSPAVPVVPVALRALLCPAP